MKSITLWILIGALICPATAAAADALKPDQPLKIHGGWDEADNDLWIHSTAGPGDIRLSESDWRGVLKWRVERDECRRASKDCNDQIIYVPAKPGFWSTRVGNCVVGVSVAALMTAAFYAGHAAGRK